MIKQVVIFIFILFFALFFSSVKLRGQLDGLPKGVKNENIWKNDIPPRLQWNENWGYCGEVSFISASLYYGQYLSQYTARAIASKNTPQYLEESQLLLGVNDRYAARKMRLNGVAWDTSKEKSTNQFLKWVKKKCLKGFPVIIGLYTNEYLFYGKTKPSAGDPDYDHIVPVFGTASRHSFNNNKYHPYDVIYFSDNGLWTDPFPSYLFQYPFTPFQASRREANRKNGNIYSLAKNGENYGIAIKGVIDLDGDTLPVSLSTNVNSELPTIVEGSNTPPSPTPVQLTITISGLKPNTRYNLYRYDDFDLVPTSHFNAHAGNAVESWVLEITSGSTYTMAEEILSDAIAAYRCVRGDAP